MTDSPAPVIRVSNLAVLEGDRRLLAPSSFTLHEGERVLLVGPSGSGKSLFVDLLLGFAGPQTPSLTVSGSILLDGEECVGGEPGAPGRGLGAVFQVHRPGLFDDLTVEQNLRFGSLDEEADQAVASELGLGALERPSATCSGGEQVRVVLARTLLKGADVLVFDEPTAGLDAGSSTQVVEAVRRSHRRLTLVVTHDYDAFADFADKVLFLDPESRRIRVVEPGATGFREIEAVLRRAAPEAPREAVALPTRGARWKARADRWADAVGEQAIDVVSALLAPVAWFRAGHPLDGPRVREALARCLAPGVAAFVATSTLLVALTATYFLFERLPKREYAEALFLDDLLAGLGLVLVRVVLPILVSMLLAAKLGASTAAHLGHMSRTRQGDALRVLGESLRRHLLLPAAGGQLAAAWVHTALAIVVAFVTSLVVFLWAHPGWSSMYVQRAWTKELAWTDLLWVAAKVGLSAVAVAAVAFRAGIEPKRKPEQVVAGIHATLLRGLLFVLVIHAIFAFLEFT